MDNVNEVVSIHVEHVSLRGSVETREVVAEERRININNTMVKLRMLTECLYNDVSSFTMCLKDNTDLTPKLLPACQFSPGLVEHALIECDILV